VALLTELLDRRVRRTGGRKRAERQIVEFYRRSQSVMRQSDIEKTDTAVSSQTDTEVSRYRYTVSWPRVRRMLVRRTMQTWGHDVSEISSDVLAMLDLIENN